MILEKENAVIENRELMGSTIKRGRRGYKKKMVYQLKKFIHGSDSVENAKMK